MVASLQPYVVGLNLASAAALGLPREASVADLGRLVAGVALGLRIGALLRPRLDERRLALLVRLVVAAGALVLLVKALLP